ncbi:M48 family metalloprotease [Desulfothermobacter acidiphilus]|uniref:M48 family metalloprotease n=1 Tax=Desulfothermobacter acidiphilus TaxID=1938353 RepID=UPI003F899627
MTVLGWTALILVTAFNMFLIAFPLAVLGLEPGKAVGAGVLLTLAFGVFGMSPLGERLSRRALGLRRPKPEEEKKLRPVYEKVLARAGWQGRAPELFLVDSEEVNGVAVGSGTIAVTTACLKLPEGELCAILAHELGHVKHGDADRSRAVVYLGKLDFAVCFLLFLVTAFFGFLSGVYTVATFIEGYPEQEEEEGLPGLFWLLAFAVFLGCKCFGWAAELLRYLVALVVFCAARKDEYRADRFAAEIGFKECMVGVLKKIEKQEKTLKLSWRDFLFSTHPTAAKRVRALERTPFPEGEPYYPWVW